MPLYQNDSKYRITKIPERNRNDGKVMGAEKGVDVIMLCSEKCPNDPVEYYFDIVACKTDGTIWIPIGTAKELSSTEK